MCATPPLARVHHAHAPLLYLVLRGSRREIYSGRHDASLLTSSSASRQHSRYRIEVHMYIAHSPDPDPGPGF
eukprot:3609471-Prymnesium_polylepis.1